MDYENDVRFAEAVVALASAWSREDAGDTADAEKKRARRLARELARDHGVTRGKMEDAVFCAASRMYAEVR